MSDAMPARRLTFRTRPWSWALSSKSGRAKLRCLSPIGGAMFVAFEDHEPVAVIVLRRPEAWNAINPEMANELAAALERFEATPELWVGVLAAEGPAFSVGADLKAA